MTITLELPENTKAIHIVALLHEADQTVTLSSTSRQTNNSFGLICEKRGFAEYEWRNDALASNGKEWDTDEDDPDDTEQIEMQAEAMWDAEKERGWGE